MKILGAVLAGGQSTRFGSDKAEALLDGIRLIDHAAASLARHCAEVIVVGRVDASYLSIPDEPKSGMGPLGGLCAALSHASHNGYDLVLTLACDVPELADSLAEALIAKNPSVILEHPIAGCWPASLAIDLRDYLLADNRRAMMAWADHIGVAQIDGSASLQNINTVEDLKSLQS